MVKEISSEEVKKHRDEKSVWMVIHNDVYDVTSFLEEHPGGAESLLEVAGEDGTQGFEDVGHSEDARESMKKYKIGTLPASETKTTEKEMHSSEKSTNLKWAIIALAGAILVGIAIRKYMR